MPHRLLLPLLCLMFVARPSSAQESSNAAGASGETVITVPIPGQTATAEVELFLPPGVPRVSSVLVFVNTVIDELLFDSRWTRTMCVRARCAMLRLSLPFLPGAPPSAQVLRNAPLGGGQALLTALNELARRTGRPELGDAGVLLWGFSAGGNFGPTFAQWRPDRTLGFVRYYSNLRGIPVDVSRIANIPALIVAGGADSVAGIEDSERAWRAGRAANAPWAFVVHPGQAHGSAQGILGSTVFMLKWIEAVLSTQGPSSGSNSASSLARRFSRDSVWLANDATGEITVVPRGGAGDGDRVATSWFPSEESAASWFRLRGACASLPQHWAEEALGASARRTSGPPEVCEYSASSEGGAAATLRLTFTQRSLPNGMQKVWADSLRKGGGTPLVGSQDRAFVFVNAQQGCRSVVARRTSDIVGLVRCGPAYDSAEAARRADGLVQRLFGRQ